MKSRAHIFVSGIVQGVYFRDFTQTHAAALGLTGWVRNVADGRVEAVIEGEQEEIERLIEHLRSGPSASRVDDVHVNWERHSGSFSAFEITYI